MPKLKVYISSTFNDLKDYRSDLINFIHREGNEDFELCEIMEYMHDRGDSEEFLETIKQQIMLCDIYILIVGFSNGSLPKSDPRLTYTQHEYKTAYDNKKKIYRFVLNSKKQFFLFKSKDRKIYDAFIESFRDVYIHWFDDIKSFKNRYFPVFFDLKPKDTLKTEYRTGTIDRTEQLNKLSYSLSLSKQPVMFYYYTAYNLDCPYYLTCRLSNIELHANQWDFGSESYIDLSVMGESDEDDYIKTRFIQNVAQKVFKKEISNLEGLYATFLNSAYDKIVIPIKVEHSTHTKDNNWLIKLNMLLKHFIDPKDLKLLGDKQVFFLINIVLETEDISQDKINILFNGLNEKDFRYNLGKLKFVEEADVSTWISGFESNPRVAEKYLKDFNDDFPKRMADIVITAEELLEKHNKNK